MHSHSAFITESTDLVEFVTQALKQQTWYLLDVNGVEQTTISAIDKVFNNCITKPFEGLTSFKPAATVLSQPL